LKTVKFKAIILNSTEECDILTNDLECGCIAAKETGDKKSAQIRQQLMDIIEEVKKELEGNKI
tara:strand:+ start:826 stop:1014 length:189 start_codon:yes stop_codon:yes gene_type:complete